MIFDIYLNIKHFYKTKEDLKDIQAEDIGSLIFAKLYLK